MPGYGASGLRELITRPIRVYELDAPDDHRGIELLTALVTAGRTMLAGQLVVPVRSGRPRGFGELRLDAVDLDDGPATRHRLYELSGRLSSTSLDGPDPDGAPRSALVVGELSAHERRHLRRDLWARGVRAHFLGEPQRRAAATREGIHRFRGDVVVILGARCGTALGGVMAALPRTVMQVTLQENAADDLALEWRLELDELELDAEPAARAGPEPEPPDPTWEQIAERVARSSGEHFVLTRRAQRQIAGKSEYPSPARMGAALERLARVATDWAMRGGSVGEAFADWAKREHGLEIALHDQELCDRKLDIFTYQDRKYSRQPHVKVDDAVAFTDCGRIYFALDDAPLRVIVDHVGLHLYKTK